MFNEVEEHVRLSSRAVWRFQEHVLRTKMLCEMSPWTAPGEFMRPDPAIHAMGQQPIDPNAWSRVERLREFYETHPGESPFQGLRREHG